MSYLVSLRASAEKELDGLPERVAERIIKRLLELETNPRPSDCKKLKGINAYRLRVGDYRVIFQINDKEKEVSIESIGHRKEIYRK